MELVPVVLEGELVRLEPVGLDHVAPLWDATLDTEIWPWMPVRPDSEQEFAELVLWAQSQAQTGDGMGFAIIHRPSDRAIGSTGFWNAAPEHRRLEIGWTWITRSFQRTGVNTETKYLLLTHAFETLGCNRVEFKADARNSRSRKALKRIGAIEEGVLRAHMLMPDGVYRDSAYYSVLADEWPRVKRQLEKLMTSRGRARGRERANG